MKTTLIKGARIVNEGKTTHGDVLLRRGRIERVDGSITDANAFVIEAEGRYLLPGMIDDQVHFREPGLTHKADIRSESRAAVAGGITSFMEMPNTVPNTLTQELLEEKYAIAARTSPANYSFYMGTSEDNLEEILKTDNRKVCGIKIFMGSSTGNMLVDKPEILEAIFSRSPMLIATHCEDEATVKRNLESAKSKYGNAIPAGLHPVIRDEDACYLSSSMAVGLAKKFGTRLHILHISTAKELSLFDSPVPLREKHITAEACIHHLWFTDADYSTKGNFIKWNPAIKSIHDRDAIREAVKSGAIDVIATDHAPHTFAEKSKDYLNAPAGGPLVQHALPALFELVHQGVFTPELIAQKCSHAVADCFRISERGFIREGYFADLVLIDMNRPWTVEKDTILYKCGWSPFEGDRFRSSITHTWVNGNLVYENGLLHDDTVGSRMTFEPR